MITMLFSIITANQRDTMKVALLFPGYGSQHVGMGTDLCKMYPIAQEIFKQAFQHTGTDFEKLCSTESNSEVCVPAPDGQFCYPGRRQQIDIINNAYPAIFVLSSAIYHILKEQGIEPTYMAGYDTGQYTAICAAGGISFTETLDLLKKYADLYMDLLRSGFYDLVKVNGITSTQLPKYLTNQTTIAVYQSRTQHVVSGTKEGIAAFKEKLRNASRPVLYEEDVGLGLNSVLMDPVVEQFRPHLREIPFKDLKIPVISNVNGTLVTKGEQLKQEIIRLITHSVKWDTVVDQLSKADLIIGIGHKANLLDLVVEKYPDKTCIALCKAEDLKKIQDFIA